MFPRSFDAIKLATHHGCVCVEEKITFVVATCIFIVD